MHAPSDLDRSAQICLQLFDFHTLRQQHYHTLRSSLCHGIQSELRMRVYRASCEIVQAASFSSESEKEDQVCAVFCKNTRDFLFPNAQLWFRLLFELMWEFFFFDYNFLLLFFFGSNDWYNPQSGQQASIVPPLAMSILILFKSSMAAP